MRAAARVVLPFALDYQICALLSDLPSHDQITPDVSLSKLAISGISIGQRSFYSKQSIFIGRNEVLMTIPNRAKSVPSCTCANMPYGSKNLGVERRQGTVCATQC